jgi:hypothetical protein
VLIDGRKVFNSEEAKKAFGSTLKIVHALYAAHGF